MYLSKYFSEAHRVCLIWVCWEAPTQELSETDNIRGAKLEVGILGIVVPLIDGVFNPCAMDTSAPLFGSPQTAQCMNEISVDEQDQAYHEAASVAHRAQGHWPLRKWCHCAGGLARDKGWSRLVGLYRRRRCRSSIDGVYRGGGFGGWNGAIAAIGFVGTI